MTAEWCVWSGRRAQGPMDTRCPGCHQEVGLVGGVMGPEFANHHLPEETMSAPTTKHAPKPDANSVREKHGHLIGWRVRGAHPAIFRSGEWAEVVAVGLFQRTENVVVPCYVVQFPDDVLDHWLILHDPTGVYEWREPDADENLVDEEYPATRAGRYRRELDHWGIDVELAPYGMCEPQDIKPSGVAGAHHRWMLVERNLKSQPAYYVTLHATPDDAAAYHDGQEYADDWVIERLTDLDADDVHLWPTETRRTEWCDTDPEPF